RHRTAINARLRTPVGARAEHAFISASTSISVNTSGGRRRDVNEPADAAVDVDRFGRVALIAATPVTSTPMLLSHEMHPKRDHMRGLGQNNLTNPRG
ncbi:MAG: hypothetical protein ACR2NR_09365, partial [Solirubrobacteraceae bacterium]